MQPAWAQALKHIHILQRWRPCDLRNGRWMGLSLVMLQICGRLQRLCREYHGKKTRPLEVLYGLNVSSSTQESTCSYGGPQPILVGYLSAIPKKIIKIHGPMAAYVFDNFLMPIRFHSLRPFPFIISQQKHPLVSFVYCDFFWCRKPKCIAKKKKASETETSESKERTSRWCASTVRSFFVVF